MPITDKASWKAFVEANTDSYGGCCVNVARRVMEILDEETGDFDPCKLIRCADDDIKTGGITCFMADCVARMVSKFHSRGEEFRRKWNLDRQIGTEGEKANEKHT